MSSDEEMSQSNERHRGAWSKKIFDLHFYHTPKRKLVICQIGLLSMGKSSVTNGFVTALLPQRCKYLQVAPVLDSTNHVTLRPKKYYLYQKAFLAQLSPPVHQVEGSTDNKVKDQEKALQDKANAVAKQYMCVDTRGDVNDGDCRPLLEFVTGLSEQTSVDIGEELDPLRDYDSKEITHCRPDIILVIIKNYASAANVDFYKRLIDALRKTEKPFRLVVTEGGRPDSPEVQELLECVPALWISHVQIYDEQDGRRDLRIDITYLDLLLSIRQQLLQYDPFIVPGPCRRCSYHCHRLVKKQVCLVRHWLGGLANREILFILFILGLALALFYQLKFH